MSAESVHTTVRLPADVADTVQSEARRLGVSKGAAMAALIRQGQSLDSDRLLAEMAAARHAAETAAARAEQATSAASTSATRAQKALDAANTAATAAGKEAESPEYHGMATGWFGRMAVVLKPRQASKGKKGE